ncbi:hypothetical protein NKG05_05725 [Oerskovia sp. M15]
MTVATGSTAPVPSAARAPISARVVTMEIPARCVIESTCSTVTSSSPATIGR